jgi:hypothetical protein
MDETRPFTRIGTMLDALWKANMDARRSISLLIAVAGSALVALAIAASPDSWAFASTYGIFIVPALVGAAIGGYLRHRVSNSARAPLWALANAAPVAAMMVATLGTAILIRPTVRTIPGLEDAWSGVLVIGIIVGFVGAFLWDRDARKRHFVAGVGLAFLLIAGGVFVRSSGDPWTPLGALVSLGGFSVLFFAFIVGRPFSDRNTARTARPDTWR